MTSTSTNRQKIPDRLFAEVLSAAKNVLDGMRSATEEAPFLLNGGIDDVGNLMATCQTALHRTVGIDNVVAATFSPGSKEDLVRDLWAISTLVQTSFHAHCQLEGEGGSAHEIAGRQMGVVLDLLDIKARQIGTLS